MGQIGETWFMPKHTNYCQIDAHDRKSKQALIKWLDTFDEYNAPHKVTYIDRHNKVMSSSNYLYISNIGKVREADFLYTGAWGSIKVSSYKDFPLQVSDKLDPWFGPHYGSEKYHEGLKRVSERIASDTKEHEEWEKKEAMHKE